MEREKKVSRINGWETDPSKHKILLVDLKHQYESEVGRPMKIREFWEMFVDRHPDFQAMKENENT